LPKNWGYRWLRQYFRRFPDGELYLKCGELDDETLIISSIVDNDMFVQTLLAIDAADRSMNSAGGALPWVFPAG